LTSSFVRYFKDFYFEGDYYYSSIKVFILFPPIDLSACLRASTWSPLSLANKALIREYLDFIISKGTYEISVVYFIFACFIFCPSLNLRSLAFTWESISLTRTYLLFIINYPLPRASKISMLKIPYSVSLFFSKIFSSFVKFKVSIIRKASNRCLIASQHETYISSEKVMLSVDSYYINNGSVWRNEEPSAGTQLDNKTSVFTLELPNLFEFTNNMSFLTSIFSFKIISLFSLRIS